MKPEHAELAGALANGAVKGLFLRPGTFTLFVNGRPESVRFTRDVVLRAFERLKTKLAAGGEVSMRLSHPGTGDMPIRWGRVLAVKADTDKGEVYLAGSEPLPEMAALMTPEAWSKLFDLGLSFYGTSTTERAADNVYEASDVDVTSIDIVDHGAVSGSRITPTIPAGLAARLALTRPGGTGRKQDGDDMKPNPSDEKDPAEAGDPPGQEKKELAGKGADAGNKPDNANAELVTLRAKAARVNELETQLTTVKTELAAKQKTETQLGAKVGELESMVTDLAAKHAALEAAKAEREAKDDVNASIVAGKAAVAEELALFEVRKAVGHDKFVAMIAARRVTVPVGERGVVEQKPAQTGDQASEGLVRRFGVEGVFQAGLPDVDADLRVHLAAKHADHPLVRKRLRAEIAAMAAKAKGGDA